MKKNLLMIGIVILLLLIIPLFSLANTTITEVDEGQEDQCSESLVTCEIIKPKRGSLYLRDIEILDNLGFTLIIGPITIEAEAKVSGLQRLWIEVVEFEIDEILTYEDTDSPYQWKWGGTVFGSHSIKAKAFDNHGNYDFDYFSNVIRFF
jgi:hypothetical protein